TEERSRTDVGSTGLNITEEPGPHASEANLVGLKSAEVEGPWAIGQLVGRGCHMLCEEAQVIGQSLNPFRRVNGHFCRIDIGIVDRPSLQANEGIVVQDV